MCVSIILILPLSDLDEELAGYVRGSTAVLMTALIAYCIISPILYYRHYRYNIDSEKIDTVCGVIFIEHTFVPIERVMQVEIGRGPINRIWGLSNVTVTTAGGTATIRFLKPEESEMIAEDLGRIVNRILRTRDSHE